MFENSSNHHPARLVIDRAAFQHNLNQVTKMVPQASVMAVIKADGYGHGMLLAARALHNADELAVTNLDDLFKLREDGCNKPVTLLSAWLSAEQFLKLASLNARPTIYCQAQLDILRGLQLPEPISVWLKVDTGMGRLGFAPSEVGQVYKQLDTFNCVAEISLMSHLANADQPSNPHNQQQLQAFTDIAAQHDFAQCSMLNSAGVVSFADKHYDLVRPGIMLYGISPTSGLSASQLNLKPAMTFISRLISVKTLSAGSSISYGGTYTLDKDTRVGAVACGYGDGYPRHARSGTPVSVNGVIVPLIGRVSMDMLMLDLTAVPAAHEGDQVILWGLKNPIENVAAWADTIAYELCCGVTARVSRHVI